MFAPAFAGARDAAHASGQIGWMLLVASLLALVGCGGGKPGASGLDDSAYASTQCLYATTSGPGEGLGSQSQSMLGASPQAACGGSVAAQQTQTRDCLSGTVLVTEVTNPLSVTGSGTQGCNSAAAATAGTAQPVQHQGNYYFLFADGTYCQYTTEPADGGSLPDIDPTAVPQLQSAGACGASRVGTYAADLETPAPATAATVSPDQGAMAFQLDGAPTFGHGFTAECPGNVLPEFGHLLGGSVGLKLARISFPLADVYHVCASVGAVGAWNGGDPANPASYDFSYLDSVLAAAVAGSASTRVILEVALDGSLPWVYAHPDCSAAPVPLPVQPLTALPYPVPQGFACLSPTEQAQRMIQGIPDYLSPEWVSASTQVLEHLVTHIQGSPYADNVVGYELMNGATLDNNYPVSYSSPAAVKRFQSFLGQLYSSSGALAAAWGQPGATFTAARPVVAAQGPTVNGCPTVESSDPGLAARSQLAPLFVPAAFKAYADSRQFGVLSNQQVAYNFADAIKRATGGAALVGVRSGEFPPQQVWCNEASNLVQWRSLDFFTYPSIDFYEVWEHYDSARYLGPFGGGGEPLMPVQGLAALNKLYVVQNDFRVYDPDDPGADAEPATGYVGDYPDSVQLVRRVFVNALVNGMSEYLWQMSYHDDQPQLDPEWAQEEQIAETAVKTDRSRVSELVYVMDPGTGQYLADAYTGGYGGSAAPSTNADAFFDKPSQQLYLTQFPEQSWARSGVPFDTIFLDQLATAKPYKVYVFFNTIGLSTAQVQTIQSVLQANRAVGIFVYADGMVDGTGDAPLQALGTHVSALTQMPVVGTTQERTVTIAPTAAYLAAGGSVGDPGRWNLQPAAVSGLGIGTGMLAPLSATAPLIPLLFPSFSIDPAADPAVTVLATYTQCGGDPAQSLDCKTTPAGAAAIAEKALPGGGDVIYSATPYLPPGLMRYALKKAGAFQYSSSEDDFYLDASFVGLHTMDGSQRDGSVIRNPLTAPILAPHTAPLAAPVPSWSVTLSFPSATALYDVFNEVEYPASATQTLPVSADQTYLFYRGTRAAWQALGGQ